MSVNFVANSQSKVSLLALSILSDLGVWVGRWVSVRGCGRHLLFLMCRSNTETIMSYHFPPLYAAMIAIGGLRRCHEIHTKIAIDAVDPPLMMSFLSPR